MLEILKKSISTECVSVELFNPRPGIDIPVFEVNSFHILNQIVGYVKYKNRTEGNVYFRGQHKLYNNMVPALFRGCSKTSQMQNKHRLLTGYIDRCRKSVKMFSRFPEPAHEPLLQHYGIKTRWLDLVDNLWVALWFGVNTWHTKELDREYYNVFERDHRNPEHEFLYLILMASDAVTELANQPGVYLGKSTHTIDLRKSCPSVFLRPHAQHALLIRKRNLARIEDVDMSENIVGILRIRTENAKEWIGKTGLISPKNLFPPVNYDFGYGFLIEQAPHEKKSIKRLGSIYTVSY